MISTLPLDMQYEKARLGGKNHFQVICLGICKGGKVIYRFVENKMMGGNVHNKLNFIQWTKK